MTVFLERKDLNHFQELVAQGFGLHFGDGRKDQLAEILVQAIHRTGRSAALYLHQLETRQLSREEWTALARELTVAETHFFRHPDQFRALRETVLPWLFRSRGPQRRLSVLSAGCASGEEAYSLALVLQESAECAPWELKVLGIDLNPGGLAKARQGCFTEWSLRGLSEELRRRYFRPAGKQHELNDTIRGLVVFAERNLVEEDPAYWQPETFDIIFCRNVLMYFTPEATHAVIARLARSLVPGGFLFVGPAETLRGVSQDFHLRHSHDTFYYQRRWVHEDIVSRNETMEQVSPPSPSATLLPPAVGESWVEAIARASERIARLGWQSSMSRLDLAAPERNSTNSTVEPAAAKGSDLGKARELLRLEQFDDALQVLQTLPAGHGNDSDAQLLQAMIFTNRGEVTQAEQLCRQVLARDELNAEAHYLLALCREHAGELQAAIEEDQAALYLDPQFAMPHLHLGLIHKRAGAQAAALQAFRQAANLLPREDASRVVLFGGGFSRETLLRLCQTEVKARGGLS